MIRYVISIVILYFFTFFIIGLVGCRSPEENKLSEYLKNIPAEESINASLYNYELITVAAHKFYQQQEYRKVLDLYKQYREVFFESSVLNESELLYWVGLSMKEIFDYSESSGSNEVVVFNTNFFNFLKENREYKKIFAIEFVGKYISNKNGEILPKKMYYKKKHFSDIVNQRVDYELEKKALREIYLKKFTNAANVAKFHKENFNHLYWLVTRYPDLFNHNQYEQLRQQYIDEENLSKSQRERYKRLKRILAIESEATIVRNNTQDTLSGKEICFPIKEPIVVYNRTDWIASRNLATIGLWEPFKVVLALEGESNATNSMIWYRIRFADDRNGYIDEESYSQSCEGSTYNNLKWNKFKSEYLSIYQRFLQKDYIEVADILSGILYEEERNAQDNEEMLIYLWTFFYQNLKEIAIRSTSLNNPFTQFAIEHSEYFEVSKDQVNLEVTDYFLKKIIEKNPESPMLQYFDGFN